MEWIEQKQKIIDRAKKKLQNPYDIYHDLAHHEAVFQGCKEIVKTENLEVDMDLLEIACFWHDVFKGSENEELLLRQELLHLDLGFERTERIIKIISEHSFGKQQTLVESKVLYDSDKIELLSIDRWQKAFDAFNRGEIDINGRDKYNKEWNRRMPLLTGNLNYEYSNRVFVDRLAKCKVFLGKEGMLDSNGELIVGSE